MDKVKETFRQKAEQEAQEIKQMLEEHGDITLEQVTVSQIYQGMRGITCIVSETSLLHPEEGIRFRGHNIPELREKLPRAEGGTQPLPEGLFYLMLVGDMPTEEDVRKLSRSLRERGEGIPAHVYKTIDALPVEAHAMTQFVTGVMALQTESLFAKAYNDGINKKEHWSYVYEDALNLIARITHIAAYVYNRKYYNGRYIAPDPELDWAANFAHMMGYDRKSFYALMRLYLTIHADHEGGNVSAHTTSLVGSALSDPYLCYAAGMNGLAGPLHGLANQEVIKWINEMLQELQTDNPSKEQIETYVRKTLEEGKVVPGYGHAVLRKTDPRFVAEMDFAKKHLADHPYINTVWKIYEVVPDILKELGKVKNPFPNVDAHSGALLIGYDFKEYEFYTVLFGVSRALGVMANLCWTRAMNFSLERPKSITTKALMRKIASGELPIKKDLGG